ncbi:hypothetical protein EMPS_01262 [Entomortierella parvispora]|uniref:AB hydrolase-1 domain-containing protein n=1 Tax=Entomortierella parvispora TaxID=205924 RepID=A0A9P3H2H5_9FUNG|nr:hypothetical protein EMPS_01262 [Entomortierella parvispora]
MIFDHVLTRGAARSLGVLAIAVPVVATFFFVYLLAYRETPLDTLVNNFPLFLQLLQSNISIPTSAAFSIPTATTTKLLDVAPHNIMAASPLPAQSLLNTYNDEHNLHESDISNFTLPPLVNGLLKVAMFLERRGYGVTATQIPGYSSLVVLFQSLERTLLGPIFYLLATRQTLSWIVSAIHLWMASELVFYVYFWRRLAHLQHVGGMMQGPKSSKDRKELFQRCMETVSPGEGARKWVETWFDTGRTAEPAKFDQVGRSNMMHWLAWSFWAASVDEIFESPSGMMELNAMVDTIERTKDIRFAKGFNPEIECIRLSQDPVIASYRPLIHYGLIWCVNVIAGVVFRLVGFVRHESKATRSSDMLYASSSSAFDPRTDLAYWHRSPVDPENKVPLVFIHGIGIGLAQYFHWVLALTTISRPIILIEVSYASSNFFLRESMTPDEMYCAVERILKEQEYAKATFMGHSLGTIVCAAICRASPASSPISIISGLILADPICFFTLHSIARNFAYRTPSTASELIMGHFAAREIGTSWYIMRRFCWHQCVMFPVAWKHRDESVSKSFNVSSDTFSSIRGRLSPVLPKQTRVFLSEKDNLLDMGLVAEYLRDQVGLKEEKEELVVMKGMEHAQFLLHPSWFLKMLKAALEC